MRDNDEAGRAGLSKLSRRHRVQAAVLGLGLLIPLAVTGLLEPDARGHGTHEQLGLPPCTIVMVFGKRCPTCGMTTAWADLVRGRPIDAVRANLGGALLCVLDLVAACWLLLAAVGRRWPGRMPTSILVAWMLAGIAAVTLIDWTVRLMAG